MYVVVRKKCNSTTIIYRLQDWTYLPFYCLLGILVSKWDHHTAKMDFQHRAGGKTGSGGVASTSESNRDRRERLRQLALETIDINKDPYFMKNHLGSYECKLCLTLHNNEARKCIISLAKKNKKPVSILHLCLLVIMQTFKLSSLLQGSYLAHTQGKKHQTNL